MFGVRKGRRTISLGGNHEKLTEFILSLVTTIVQTTHTLVQNINQVKSVDYTNFFNNLKFLHLLNIKSIFEV